MGKYSTNYIKQSLVQFIYLIDDTESRELVLKQLYKFIIKFKDELYTRLQVNKFTVSLEIEFLNFFEN